MEAAAEGQTVIVTSALTLCEVLWLRPGKRIKKEKTQIVLDAFEHPFIKVRPLERMISEEARNFVWDHDVKPRDAIHVATAVHFDIPILETFDKHLLSLDGKLGDEKSPLIIRKPYAEKQTTLFEDEEE